MSLSSFAFSSRRRPALRAALPLAAALGLGLGAAPTATASPFDARTVPAQVDAVGHLDVEALRHTQLYGALGGQAALDKAIDDAPPDVKPLARALARSVRGATFWYDGEHGALQITTADARAVAALLPKLPAKRARTVDGYGVYAIEKHGDRLQLAAVGDTVVLSDDAGSVDRAVRVLAGKAPTAASASRLPRLGGQGVFMLAALGDDLLNKLQGSAKSKLMQLSAKSIVVDFAETAGQLVVSGRAEMKSADALQKARSIVEGLRALATFSDDPRVAGLVSGITVSATGLTLEVTAKAAIADLKKLLPTP